MQAKEAAERLGISQRMLRHYEKEGLLQVNRTSNGYRTYSETVLRRAARIRDFIEVGFSTREIRAMSACLSEDSSGPCEDGIEKLNEKLKHIDRLRADLDARRDAVVDRLAKFQRELSFADSRDSKMATAADEFVPAKVKSGLNQVRPV